MNPVDITIIVSNNGNIGDELMVIQILGTGCPKCKTLEANAVKAVEEGNIAATIVKVTDLDEIMDMGVMMTPALAIDGDVKSMGKVLNKDQVLSLIKESL